MMKKEKLIKLINQKNGYLCVCEAQELGISRTYIQEFVKTNKLEKVAHGVYKMPNVWTDELYVLSLKNKKMVFSFDTALMLHGLTEREPSEIYVTVSRVYNTTHLRKQGVTVHYVKNEWLDLGKTVAKTVYGNEVVVYDAERAICDIVRVKNKKDPQMFYYAIKEYAKSKNKNLHKLMKYSKEFGIEEEIRNYMEILLWLLKLQSN